jgi:hypothetical protein
MTRQIHPTDPIRRNRRDFEPARQWPEWVERLAGWIIAISLLAGVALLMAGIWALVKVVAYITRTR